MTKDNCEDISFEELRRTLIGKKIVDISIKTKNPKGINLKLEGDYTLFIKTNDILLNYY